MSPKGAMESSQNTLILNNSLFGDYESLHETHSVLHQMVSLPPNNWRWKKTSWAFLESLNE